VTTSRHPAAWIPLLSSLTTYDVREIVASPPTAILVPVGSVEPHGPHLPLSVDTTISEVAAMRAARLLVEKNVDVYIAPSVPYGVTDFASGFAGTVGVSASALTALLASIVERLVHDGWSHVCIVNNHLEPAQDEAVRAAIAKVAKGRASVACPLTKRWGRTLSDEFKKGNCHAGRYETSLALAAGVRVRAEYTKLAPLEVSLSTEIKAGKTRFTEMGMDRAYTGAPDQATEREGEELFDKLAEMIATEVLEGIAAA
jgi:creatinine amidohydrolase